MDNRLAADVQTCVKPVSVCCFIGSCSDDCISWHFRMMEWTFLGGRAVFFRAIFPSVPLPAQLAMQTEQDRFTEWMYSSSASQVSRGCSKYALIAYCVSIIAVNPFRTNTVLLCWKPSACVCPMSVAANCISLTSNAQQICSLFWLCCLFPPCSLSHWNLCDQNGNNTQTSQICPLLAQQGTSLGYLLRKSKFLWDHSLPGVQENTFRAWTLYSVVDSHCNSGGCWARDVNPNQHVTQLHCHP